MQLNLKEKTAVITGGSAGIGKATAHLLLEEGMHLLLVARDSQKLDFARQELLTRFPEGQVHLLSADLSTPEGVLQVFDTALKTLGRVDLLVNNAGAARGGAFLDLPEEAFWEAWQLKLMGAIRLTRQVLPHMLERRSGSIVNIVGFVTRRPMPHFLPGGTANAALLHFTKGLSRAVAGSGVRINAISPGTTDTERAQKLAQEAASQQGIPLHEHLETANRAIPVGHKVNPREIAALVALLASDWSSSITGAELLIDGGQALA